MATLLIAPIALVSIGGYAVQITGIEPTNHDCIVGTIQTPGMGLIQGRWNLGGFLRGGTNQTNLDMRSNDMIDLRQLAISLGAQP